MPVSLLCGWLRTRQSLVGPICWRVRPCSTARVMRLGSRSVAGIDKPHAVEYDGRQYKFTSAEQATAAVDAVLDGAPEEAGRPVWFDVVNAGHTPVRLVWTPGVPLTFIGQYPADE